MAGPDSDEEEKKEEPKVEEIKEEPKVEEVKEEEETKEIKQTKTMDENTKEVLEKL